jgi:DNA-binding transcriptional LysR family regulator
LRRGTDRWAGAAFGPPAVQVHDSFVAIESKLSFMLDVRRLRLLSELHERGTVTAVARALAYTPSAVSQQLATLEREAGVQLLERRGRRLRLTDAGRGLVEHADAVIARLELAESELAAAAGDAVAGRVRVAAFQTAASGLVLPLLGSLRAEHPELRLELVELEAEEGLELLLRGAVDLVVAEEYEYAPRTRDRSLVRRDICRDPLVLVLPDGHPLAAADPEAAPLAGLAGEAWATPRLGTAFVDSMVRACRALGGFEPDRRHVSNDLAVLEQLVAAGEAVALLPSLGRPGRTPGVAVRRVAEAPLERGIFIALRRGSAGRAALAAVADALRRQARAIGLPGA